MSDSGGAITLKAGSGTAVGSGGDVTISPGTAKAPAPLLPLSDHLTRTMGEMIAKQFRQQDEQIARTIDAMSPLTSQFRTFQAEEMQRVAPDLSPMAIRDFMDEKSRMRGLMADLNRDELKIDSELVARSFPNQRIEMETYSSSDDGDEVCITMSDGYDTLEVWVTQAPRTTSEMLSILSAATTGLAHKHISKVNRTMRSDLREQTFGRSSPPRASSRQRTGLTSFTAGLKKLDDSERKAIRELLDRGSQAFEPDPE